MAGKTTPWWRDVLTRAVRGIRAGVAALLRPGKKQAGEPTPIPNQESIREEETALTDHSPKPVPELILAPEVMSHETANAAPDESKISEPVDEKPVADVAAADELAAAAGAEQRDEETEGVKETAETEQADPETPVEESLLDAVTSDDPPEPPADLLAAAALGDEIAAEEPVEEPAAEPVGETEAGPDEAEPEPESEPEALPGTAIEETVVTPEIKAEAAAAELELEAAPEAAMQQDEAEEEPAHDVPVEDLPVEAAPADDLPAENEPVEAAVIEDAAVEDAPGENVQADGEAEVGDGPIAEEPVLEPVAEAAPEPEFIQAEAEAEPVSVEADASPAPVEENAEPIPVEAEIAAVSQPSQPVPAQEEADPAPAAPKVAAAPPPPAHEAIKRADGPETSPVSVMVSQVYEGPFDLLLDLIRKQDIDIYDIPIARITAQFLAYVNQLKASDMDVAGEFIYTASLLIHIKSKMLLPRAPSGPDDQAEDPRRELVERLLEHERFKNAAQMLQQKQMLEAATWTNPGVREFREDAGAEPELAADTDDLVRIFREILDRARNRPIINVQEDSVTVGQMIQFLARRLTMEDKPVALRRLLSHTKSERALIAMFLALLELVRLQAILLRQDRHFSEIFIKKNSGFDGVMNEGLARDDWQ